MEIVGWVLEGIGWLTIAVTGGIVFSQAAGWSGTRLVATLQSLTPHLTLLLAPIAAVALWQNRYWMAAVAGIVGLGILAVAAPLVFTSGSKQPAPNAAPLRVGLANLLYGNEQIDDVAHDLAARDLDVIVFNEYTPQHEADLLASSIANLYPHKVGQSAPFAGGISVWSRHPLTVNTPPETFDPSLDVTATTAGGPVRIIAVHPRTPVYDFQDWKEDLSAIGRINLSPDAPTLLLGDFNASYWHPGFRKLLKSGYVDAHIAAGHGFSASWPIDSVIPPFVRLDHALTSNGLVSMDIDDFDIPGSDHRGLVVTVAPTG